LRPSILTLSLHDALPICNPKLFKRRRWVNNMTRNEAKPPFRIAQKVFIANTVDTGCRLMGPTRDVITPTSPKLKKSVRYQARTRSEEHTSELQSRVDLVC